ncbi:hypothetical protein LDENG_00274690 [Lucifuga dentata]|nr:hypothetical protein LDENG_00274690 [Lucifuga dentata]
MNENQNKVDQDFAYSDDSYEQPSIHDPVHSPLGPMSPLTSNLALQDKNNIESDQDIDAQDESIADTSRLTPTTEEIPWNNYALNMGHLFSSLSAVNRLENGGLFSQSISSPTAFMFHLSQHMLASQGLSLSPFEGLFSYPYHYMEAPAAVAPAHPSCTATSTLARNQCFSSFQPWLRFSSYQISTSVASNQNLVTTRPNASLKEQSEFSKSGSVERESSPVSQNHNFKIRNNQKTIPPKAIVKDSIHELKNIQKLVRRLDKPYPP